MHGFLIRRRWNVREAVAGLTSQWVVAGTGQASETRGGRCRGDTRSECVAQGSQTMVTVMPFWAATHCERLVLSVEVEAITARVIDVDGKLTRLKAGTLEQVGGIRLGDSDGRGLALAEDRAHESSCLDSHQAAVEIADDLITIVSRLPSECGGIEILEIDSILVVIAKVKRTSQRGNRSEEIRRLIARPMAP